MEFVELTIWVPVFKAPSESFLAFWLTTGSVVFTTMCMMAIWYVSRVKKAYPIGEWGRRIPSKPLNPTSLLLMFLVWPLALVMCYAILKCGLEAKAKRGIEERNLINDLGMNTKENN